MRTVIITCTIKRYEKEKQPGEEIWATSTASFKPTYQENIDRTYIANSGKLTERYLEGWMGLQWPVYMIKPSPEIPMSRVYPRSEIIRELKWDYFTSSIAYMMAHAIYEKVDRLVLYGVNALTVSKEYFDQKPCHDFWAGIALGRGIEVVPEAGSQIGQPFPWLPRRYGEFTERETDVYNRAHVILRNALREIDQVTREREGQYHGIPTQFLSQLC